MTYGYCRVSTKHQSLQRQINALINYGINERFIFSDKYAGKTLGRKGLNDLLYIIKQGYNIVIKEIGRLGRNHKSYLYLSIYSLSAIDIKSCLL